MMYLLAPEVHAQVVEALHRVNRVDEDCDILSPDLADATTDAEDMLKAMQPVSPSIYSITYAGAHVNNFHRVQENAEHEMRRLERNFPEPVGKRKVAALYTPTKD